MQGVLAGRYRLERQLGKGGMGSVWLAEHLALRSWVAVKLMDPAIAATPEGAERFRREAQAAASLRSAHVVQVLDYGVDGATPYLVMELMQGESLASCLEREKRLAPQRMVAIMTQVARALGHTHAADIVHRDLKPDNIFLVREDDQELVKILDFGIAKTPQSQFGGMETRTGVTMGTPYYMSPEQVEGKKALDFRTDLWAMAVIASECMTGVRPFDGSTFGELLLNICARPIPMPSSQGVMLRGFDEWFAKATNREPGLRFASAQELASTLKDLVERAPQGAPFASPAGATAYMPPPTVPGQGNAAYGPALTADPATAAPMTAAPMTGGHPAYVPATVGPGPATYGPAPTVGPAPLPMTVSGNAPSVSSINTSQALSTAAGGGASALPWILLALVVLVGAVGATVMVMRSQSSNAAAQGAPSGASLGTPAPLPNTDLAPTTTAEPSVANDAPSKRAPSKHVANGEPRPDVAPAPAPPAPTPPVVVPDIPPVAAARKPVTSASSTTCFSDPFSGQLRPTSVSHAPGAASFACKQDPFTGKYKKL